MTWEVVVGIGTLCGFVVAIVKTVIPLTNAITILTEKTEDLSEKLVEKTEDLSKKLGSLDERKTKAHTELWLHNKEQDKRLDEHAQRLHDLDGK